MFHCYPIISDIHCDNMFFVCFNGINILLFIPYYSYPGLLSIVIPSLVMFHYPLVNVYSLRTWTWPIEIVDLPSYKIVIFNSYVSHYQRVQDGAPQDS